MSSKKDLKRIKTNSGLGLKWIEKQRVSTWNPGLLKKSMLPENFKIENYTFKAFAQILSSHFIKI